MCFADRPVRAASWDCVMPRSSKTSRSVSPGGRTRSGSYRWAGARLLAIGVSFWSVVVNDLDHGHTVDPSPIEAAVLLRGRRVLRRDEDEPVALVQIDRQLASSLPGELVATAWQRPHVLEGHGGCQLLETSGDPLGALLAPQTLKVSLVRE